VSKRSRKSLLKEGIHVPIDFGSALKAGWCIVGEITQLRHGCRRRRGRVILSEGKRFIQVEYSGTLKTGFKFSEPGIVT
jgi:hypothetical protein